MDIIHLAEVIIGSIISLGVLIAGAGYGYGQFYKGKNSKTLDDFNLFNQQIDALKKIVEQQTKEIGSLQSKHSNEIKALQDDIKRHTQEIGRLQGVNEEKEKKIIELTNLLQNRDPALLEYMKFGRESAAAFAEQIKIFNTKLDQVLTRLNQ